MSKLFEPIDLRGLRLSNRIVVSPMCQYSAEDGVAQPWHTIHVGTMALSGAGAVILEATGVSEIGRISHHCLGLYDDRQEAALHRLVADTRRYASTPIGIQLAHAGRKASCAVGWERAGGPIAVEDGGWRGVGPSALPFAPGWTTPLELDGAGLQAVKTEFVLAAERAERCGFDLIEIHAAHGYLLHSFLSPLSNHRTDEYGGSDTARVRYPLEVLAAIRAAWPASKPLGVRINAEDGHPEGLTVDDACRFATELRRIGIDYVTTSAGHAAPNVRLPQSEPGYMVHYAQRLKAETGMTTMAVGMIVTPEQAEEIVSTGKADLVGVGRGFLDNPRWALHAAATLGVDLEPAPQYIRVHARRWPAANLVHPRAAGR